MIGRGPLAVQPNREFRISAGVHGRTSRSSIRIACLFRIVQVRTARRRLILTSHSGGPPEL